MQASCSVPKRMKYTLKQVHHACVGGDVDAVKNMAGDGVNFEEENKKGERALHRAAIGQRPDVIKLLVGLGVDINAANKCNDTALHTSVEFEDVDSVRILLESEGIDVNVQDKNGYTPLHLAVRSVSTDMQKIAGMIVDFPTVKFTIYNRKGYNAFHEAARSDNHFALQRILSKDPSILNVQNGFSALHHAAHTNSYNALMTLLQQDNCAIELKNGNQRTALYTAVEEGHCKIVEALLEAKADINTTDVNGDTPLHISLKKRFDLRAHSISPSEAPAVAEVAKEFWSNPKPGVDGSLALACFLVSKGADIDRKNKAGKTPLQIAGNADVAEVLLTWRAKYQSSEAPNTGRQNGMELEERVRRLEEVLGCGDCADLP